MNPFKSIYEVKKREAEIKQGKHGLLPKYVALGFFLLLYGCRAFFMPYKEWMRPIVFLFAVIFIISLVRDLKNYRKSLKTPMNKNI